MLEQGYEYDHALASQDTSKEAAPNRVKALEMLNDMLEEYGDGVLGVEEGTKFAEQRAYWRERHGVELTESLRLIQLEMAVDTCLHVLLEVRDAAESYKDIQEILGVLEEKQRRLDNEVQEIITNPASVRELSRNFGMYHPDAFEALAMGYADIKKVLTRIQERVADLGEQQTAVLDYVASKVESLRGLKKVLKQAMAELDDSLDSYSGEIVTGRNSKKNSLPSIN